MRIVVFFDLPTETAAQRKDYRMFRKFLIKEGYLMLQESVYVKLVVNDGSMSRVLVRLKNNRPHQGLVQALKVTEKQFATMEDITGKRTVFEEVDTMESLVIL